MLIRKPAKWMTDFYQGKRWRALSLWAKNEYGRKCMRCKSADRIETDHIYSRSRYWFRRYRKSNMQILCHDCNVKKGSISTKDYRPIKTKLYYAVIRMLKKILWLIALIACFFLISKHPSFPSAYQDAFSSLRTLHAKYQYRH